MEEKSRAGEGRYLVCWLTSAANEKYAKQPKSAGDLVREKLTLLLQRLCGVYVAPCKEYDAPRSNDFQGGPNRFFSGNSAICRAI
jgi:hypothetical protein